MLLDELLSTRQKVPDRLLQARILIADPHAQEARSLSQILRQAGCRNLVMVEDQEQIIACLRQGYRQPSLQIDLIVLSLSLRHFDVQRFTHQLTNNQANTVPIVLLGRDGKRTLIEQLDLEAAGACDLLLAPLQQDEAILRINLALQYAAELKCRIEQEDSLKTELAERRIMETRLNYLLNHDELTSLPSRHRLESALKLSLGKSHNLQRSYALLYVDIDQFRIINDILGHDRGDRLLIRVADLLRHIAPPKSLVARIGSDEFALLLDGLDQAAVLDLARSIHRKLETMLCGQMRDQISINANIGVVMITPEGKDEVASSILAKADQACHIARDRATDRVYLFDERDTEIQKLQNNRQCVTVVRKALSNDWFELYLQPIVRLHDQKTSHYEVLLRLTDDSGQQHSPANFIPAAESTGLIHKVDFWVVDHALSLLESLPTQLGEAVLSINLSGDGLQTPALLELIKNKIDYHALNPARIMFELTETAAVKDVQQIRETITRLRSIGCRFAIDDFGTGFSSFNYIKNYPVDIIKIDGMFIRNLLDESTDQILVKSMVEVAHNLGKKVVAEYVEDQQTMDLLKQYHVDYVQGYFLGKPISAASLLGL